MWMTWQEAIDYLKVIREHIDNPLEEVSLTHSIIALTGGIGALENQIAQKTVKDEYGRKQCPTCSHNQPVQKYKYCPFCGQRIDWSEEE